MRIAILGTDGIPARYGGFETCAEEIGTRLAERGHRVTVYCKKSDSAAGLTSYKGVDLRQFPQLRNQVADYVFSAFATTVHASMSDADILHFFGCDQVLSTLLPRMLGKKVVLSLDGLEWRRESYPWLFRAYLRSYAELAMVFPNRVTVDSRRSEEWYMKRTGIKPLFIPYGANASTGIDFDILDKYGLKNGQYVLFVGRLVREKGAHVLIKAFKEVVTDAQLVIVGDSKEATPYVSRLKEMADSRVKFLGFVHGRDFETIRNGALIYVHPSSFDGTSISLLSALASGKCIISSNLKDNVDVAGDSALYFSLDNSEDLRDRIQCLLDNPERMRTLAISANTRASNMFGWEDITDKYERLYFELHQEESSRDGA